MDTIELWGAELGIAALAIAGVGVINTYFVGGVDVLGWIRRSWSQNRAYVVVFLLLNILVLLTASGLGFGVSKALSAAPNPTRASSTRTPTATLIPTTTLVSTISTATPISAAPVIPTATLIPPTPTPTPIPASVASQYVTDGISTSGYQTAVLGQEFDAYYVITNEGNGPFNFRQLYFGIDAQNGQNFYLGGEPTDTNGVGPDYSPIQPGAQRRGFMEVSQFASGCMFCTTGTYRLYAVAVLSDGTAVAITNQAVNKSYQVNVGVCSQGMPGTPNRCP